MLMEIGRTAMAIIRIVRLSRPLAMGVNVESVVVLSRMIAVMVSTINSHTSRASIRMIGVTSIAGLSRPLVKTMVAISVRTKTLGASGFIAHSSIGMVGQSRSVTGISRPLVKTMVAITIRAETLGASGLIAYSSIGMVGQGGSITGISFSLVETMMAIASMKTLDASVCIAGTTIRMIGVTTIAGLCSHTPKQSKNCENLYCHGVLPSSVRRMTPC